MLWKINATIWVNPAQIVEVYDNPEQDTVLVNYAVGTWEVFAHRHFEGEDRQALLDYLNNPPPEGFH